jgi:hypothetical protein
MNDVNRRVYDIRGELTARQVVLQDLLSVEVDRVVGGGQDKFNRTRYAN